MKLLLCLGLSIFSLPTFAQRPLNRRLQHELDSLQVQDWRYRNLMGKLNAGKADSLAAALHLPSSQVAAYIRTQMQRADSSNLRRVEEIIWRYGYPGKSLVGSPTNEAAWHVLQHSSKIPQYLIWVKGAAEAGEIPYPRYAQMLDRKLMDDGQEQVYGTQWAGYTVLDHETGRQHTIAFIWPIADPRHTDQRRRKAGFSTSLAESSAKLGIPYQPMSLEYALWLQEEATKLAQALHNYLLAMATAPTAAPISFCAVLEAGGPSFMPTQLLVVPEAVWAALGGKTTKRVIATLNGHPERLGLLPLAGGGRYLLLRKVLCQRLGLAVGQEVAVSLAPDPDPEYVELPDELAEALAAWPEAETAFYTQTGAMRRAIARKVADAKRPETRARYAVELTERLARGAHPFRA